MSTVACLHPCAPSIVQVVLPIKIALKLTDHTCHTTSKVYTAFLEVKSAIERWRPWSGGASLKEAMLEKVSDRWKWMEFNIHYFTHATDPEFQRLEFDDRTEQGLKEVLKHWAPNREAERAAYQQWVDYCGTVLSVSAMSDAKAMHPKQFWLKHGKKWPDLQPISVKAHSCGNVATPCERNWSAWKHVYNQRYSLGNGTGEKWVYVYSNNRELAFQAGAVPGRARATYIPWGYVK